MMDNLQTVGESELRKDSQAKVTGEAQYAADICLPDMRYAMLLRSAHHHARIVHIDTEAAQAIPGVMAVPTADDIPGSKTFGLLVQDRPVLAIDVVRHMGEPVVLIVAESKAAARRALETTIVAYEPLPVVFDPVAALEINAPQVHANGNLLTHYDVCDGDVETGFAESDVVLEEIFLVPRVSPAYMEPESSLARWNDDGTLTVWVSSQSPFDDRRQIAQVLGLPEEQIQVKSAAIGGAFGGKDDSGLHILSALGAWVIKGTVRLVNTRRESFLAHPKRHPARIAYKMGTKDDGTLLALYAKVHLDTGAYASYGTAVGGHLTEMVQGPYRIPNVRVETLVAYTNSPFSGAMRGFGGPQANFATESMIDMLAAELRMDPLELRRRNILKPGDKLFTRVVVNETALSLQQCLEHAEVERQRLCRVLPTPGKVSGVGIAMGMQGMGCGAKVADDSTHRLEWLPDGTVRLYLGAPDLGQGLATIAEQMTAEALGLPYGAVQAVQLDTSVTPNGGGTFASRTTYLAGNALLRAAERLKTRLLDEVAKMLGVWQELLTYDHGKVLTPDGKVIPVAEFTCRAADAGIEIKAEGSFSFPYPEETTPQHLPVGMPHVIFCFGAHVVRVEVDPELGTVGVKDHIAIHDVGRVINSASVEGQIEGGAITGLGYALYESMVLKKNGLWIDSFSEYLLPTAKDIPQTFRSVILQIPEASGPYGAKGVGEIGLVPVAAAIANAVNDAVRVRVTMLPISPEALVRYPEFFQQLAG